MNFQPICVRLETQDNSHYQLMTPPVVIFINHTQKTDFLSIRKNPQTREIHSSTVLLDN